MAIIFCLTDFWKVHCEKLHCDRWTVASLPLYCVTLNLGEPLK